MPLPPARLPVLTRHFPNVWCWVFGWGMHGSGSGKYRGVGRDGFVAASHVLPLCLMKAVTAVTCKIACWGTAVSRRLFLFKISHPMCLIRPQVYCVQCSFMFLSVLVFMFAVGWIRYHTLKDRFSKLQLLDGEESAMVNNLYVFSESSRRRHARHCAFARRVFEL